MNYIFEEDKYEKSNFDAFESSYKLERISFENKELESFNNSLQQLDGSKIARYEFANVFENKIAKYESVSAIANFEKESESSYGKKFEPNHCQESTNLLYQIESPTGSKHYSNTESPQDIIVNSKFVHSDNSLIKDIEKTKATTLNNTSELIEDKVETAEQTFIDNQTQFNCFKRKRMSGYYRWNRKDDTKLFSELREAWKQSNIDPEDFWQSNCFISSKHQDILNTLVYKLQWRRDAFTLLNRIRALSKKQTLSGRQVQALKKWIKLAKANNEELSIESVADLFPGKSLTSLKVHFDQILRSLSA